MQHHRRACGGAYLMLGPGRRGPAQAGLLRYVFPFCDIWGSYAILTFLWSASVACTTGVDRRRESRRRSPTGTVRISSRFLRDVNERLGLRPPSRTSGMTRCGHPGRMALPTPTRFPFRWLRRSMTRNWGPPTASRHPRSAGLVRPIVRILLSVAACAPSLLAQGPPGRGGSSERGRRPRPRRPVRLITAGLVSSRQPPWAAPRC